MDAIRQQLLRVQQQLNGLSASQKMLTASLMAVMVMTVVWSGRMAGVPEMEPLLDQTMSAEEMSRIKSYLAGRGVAYRIEGDRVLLPADQRMEAMIDLGVAQLLPKDTSNGFDKIVAQMSPWDPQSKTRLFLEAGKGQMLSQIIRSFPGVEDATVMVDTQSERRIGGDLEPTASVTVRMRSGERGGKDLVVGVANLVCGAVSGLTMGNVKVVVDGRHWPVPGADGLGGSDPSDLLQNQIAAEQKYAATIYKHLGFIPGLYATVTVKMNTVSSTVKSNSVESVQSAEIEATSEIEETVGPAPAAVEPGVVPNAGLSVNAPLAAEGGRTSREQTKTLSQPFASTEEKVEHHQAGESSAVSAAVRLPRNYLLSVWRQNTAQAEGAMPDAAEFQRFVDAEAQSIREEVKNCTGIADASAISVALYTDMAEPGVGAAEAAGTAAASVVGVVGGYGKQLVLGMLAAASLVMVGLIARRPSDASGTSGGAGGSIDLSPAAVAAAMAGAGPMGVGSAAPGETYTELGEHNGLLVAQELDDDQMEAQQMVEQVATLVKENPDAAASLVQRWMSR